MVKRQTTRMPVTELRKWHEVETKTGWRFVNGEPEDAGTAYLRVEFTDGTNGYYRHGEYITVACDD